MNDNPEVQLESIWDSILVADFMEDRQQQRELLSKAITSLHSLIESGYLQALYPLGYAYYCHPDRRPGAKEVEYTERTLKRAIKEGIEPDHARLYLAYHYYDFSKFDESAMQIQQIDKSQFHENLCIRCKELELCNLILIKGAGESQQHFDEYADFIGSLESPDYPPPLLMNTLEQLAEDNELPISILPSLKKLDRAYHDMMSDNWFQKLVSKQ